MLVEFAHLTALKYLLLRQTLGNPQQSPKLTPQVMSS